MISLHHSDDRLYSFCNLSPHVAALDFMDSQTTIAFIFAYFRYNDFFGFNVKCNDFVDIISKYTIEQNIKFGKNNENIIAFNGERCIK